MGMCVSHKSVYITTILISTFMFLFVLNGSVNAEEITGTVLDSKTNEPVANATVTINHIETESELITKTDSNGYFEVTGLNPGLYRVNIEAKGYHSLTYEVEVGIFRSAPVYLEPISDKGDEGIPLLILFQSTIVIIIVFVISLIMYTKIKREKLLKNALRKRIFDYIRENPGKHYRAILNDLNLSMGVLTYHINRLEKAQYLISRQDGMFRRFYIRGPKTEMRFFLSDIQKSILNVIRENGGISQTQIAEKIDVSRKVVNYHVNILDQAGFIFVESRGRETACYSNEY
jgi:DNA-binding MarR family transcriptional regulator/5-hydroxyisourate hydrolase-like protein (transthyretin family)